MTKGPEELALMAESGRLLASVFGLIDRTALCGLSTLAVDTMVERFIVDELSARPASKGQYGYGFVLNASVNQVVCHGVPTETEVLKDGDIVNIEPDMIGQYVEKLLTGKKSTTKTAEF